MSNDAGTQILTTIEGEALKSLPDILTSIAGGLAGPGTDFLANLEHGLGGALDRVGGHTSGNELGRAICKHIDAVYENGQLTPAQKDAVAQALAANVASQLRALADGVVAYPALQSKVANASSGAAADAARGPRNGAVVALKGGFAALIDAAAGNVVSTSAPVETAQVA